MPRTITEPRLIGNRVLVKPIENQEKTPGGVIIPDISKGKPTKGEVIAVGSGRPLDNGERMPVEMRENDIVDYKAYAGTHVDLDGEDFVVLDETDVLIVLGAKEDED